MPTDREDAARALAEAVGWEYEAHWRGDYFRLPYKTEGCPAGPTWLDIPAPDAPLHEQLQFVGRLAEALGAFPTITCGNVGKKTPEGYRIQYEATVAFDMPQFEMSDRPAFAQATAPDLVLAAMQTATEAARGRK